MVAEHAPHVEGLRQALGAAESSARIRRINDELFDALDPTNELADQALYANIVGAVARLVHAEHVVLELVDYRRQLEVVASNLFRSGDERWFYSRPVAKEAGAGLARTSPPPGLR